MSLGLKYLVKYLVLNPKYEGYGDFSVVNTSNIVGLRYFFYYLCKTNQV